MKTSRLILFVGGAKYAIYRAGSHIGSKEDGLVDLSAKL